MSIERTSSSRLIPSPQFKSCQRSQRYARKNTSKKFPADEVSIDGNFSYGNRSCGTIHRIHSTGTISTRGNTITIPIFEGTENFSKAGTQVLSPNAICSSSEVSNVKSYKENRRVLKDFASEDEDESEIFGHGPRRTYLRKGICYLGSILAIVLAVSGIILAIGFLQSENQRILARSAQFKQKNSSNISQLDDESSTDMSQLGDEEIETVMPEEFIFESELSLNSSDDDEDNANNMTQSQIINFSSEFGNNKISEVENEKKRMKEDESREESLFRKVKLMSTFKDSSFSIQLPIYSNSTNNNLTMHSSHQNNIMSEEEKNELKSMNMTPNYELIKNSENINPIIDQSEKRDKNFDDSEKKSTILNEFKEPESTSKTFDELEKKSKKFYGFTNFSEPEMKSKNSELKIYTDFSEPEKKIKILHDFKEPERKIKNSEESEKKIIILTDFSEPERKSKKIEESEKSEMENSSEHIMHHVLPPVAKLQTDLFDDDEIADEQRAPVFMMPIQYGGFRPLPPRAVPHDHNYTPKPSSKVEFKPRPPRPIIKFTKNREPIREESSKPVTFSPLITNESTEKSSINEMMNAHHINSESNQVLERPVQNFKMAQNMNNFEPRRPIETTTEAPLNFYNNSPFPFEFTFTNVADITEGPIAKVEDKYKLDPHFLTHHHPSTSNLGPLFNFNNFQTVAPSPDYAPTLLPLSSEFTNFYSPPQLVDENKGQNYNTISQGIHLLNIMSGNIPQHLIKQPNFSTDQFDAGTNLNFLTNYKQSDNLFGGTTSGYNYPGLFSNYFSSELTPQSSAIVPILSSFGKNKQYGETNEQLFDILGIRSALNGKNGLSNFKEGREGSDDLSTGASETIATHVRLRRPA